MNKIVLKSNLPDIDKNIKVMDQSAYGQVETSLKEIRDNMQKQRMIKINTRENGTAKPTYQSPDQFKNFLNKASIIPKKY